MGALVCRILKFLQIWQNFWFLHVCCVRDLKFLYAWRIFRFLSCVEIWNFSTWPICSPPIYRWSGWQMWGMCKTRRCTTVRNSDDQAIPLIWARTPIIIWVNYSNAEHITSISNASAAWAHQQQSVLAASAHQQHQCISSIITSAASASAMHQQRISSISSSAA